MNELIVKIMKVALEKNGKNKNTIFIRYSGHVEWLEVEVYKNGWNEKEEKNFSKTICLDSDECIESLQRVLDYLKGLED